jgi:hypothetical protein
MVRDRGSASITEIGISGTRIRRTLRSSATAVICASIPGLARWAGGGITGRERRAEVDPARAVIREDAAALAEHRDDRVDVGVEARLEADLRVDAASAAAAAGVAPGRDAALCTDRAGER